MRALRYFDGHTNCRQGSYSIISQEVKDDTANHRVVGRGEYGIRDTSCYRVGHFLLWSKKGKCLLPECGRCVRDTSQYRTISLHDHSLRWQFFEAD